MTSHWLRLQWRVKQGRPLVPGGPAPPRACPHPLSPVPALQWRPPQEVLLGPCHMPTWSPTSLSPSAQQARVLQVPKACPLRAPALSRLPRLLLNSGAPQGPPAPWLLSSCPVQNWPRQAPFHSSLCPKIRPCAVPQLGHRGAGETLDGTPCAHPPQSLAPGLPADDLRPPPHLAPLTHANPEHAQLAMAVGRGCG